MWTLRFAPGRPERRWRWFDLDLARHEELRVGRVLDESVWVIRSALRDGRFCRPVGPLAGVDDAAKTAYEDGMLEVPIPRLAGAETVSTKVPISRS